MALFCKLFAGFGITNKSAISLFFSYLILALSLAHCPILYLSFYLKVFPTSGRNCLLFPLYYQATIHRHSFFTINDAAGELARQGALLVPFTVPCCLFPLIFRIHSSFFSYRRRTVSSKCFDTQVPSVSTEKLVLSCLRCNGHGFLLSSYISWIGRIENPSCNAC